MAKWNPWRALRDCDELEFGLVDLPDEVGGGVYLPQRDGWAAVLVDKRLGRRQRKCALGHEVLHHLSGGGVVQDGMPETWLAVVVRDETAINRELARRLVPLGELAGLMAEAHDLGVSVHPWEIGERFDVSDEVAELAMRMVQPH